MESLKDSIEITFSPLGFMAILMAAGIILALIRKHSRTGRRLLICSALLFFIYLFSPLSTYLTWNLEKQFEPLLAPPESPKISRIVVLAGYAEAHPEVSVASNVSSQTIGSLTEGLRLYRLAPQAKLILSGGIPCPGQKPAALTMADFLHQMGVPSGDLIVEGKSRNTYENFTRVKELVGEDPFILVAAACDLRRAVAVAKKLRMKPIPAPSCIRTLQKHPTNLSSTNQLIGFLKCPPSFENFVRLQLVYHEYLGYIWYRILDRV